MSGKAACLELQKSDVSLMLAAGVHVGTKLVNHQMKPYVYSVNHEGLAIINLKKVWDKLLLAARAIAAVENMADVCIVSSRPMGQRAVLKFARYTNATPIAGRFTPGTFTNQIQAAYREPRLLVINDPISDHQPVTEASYSNIPVIAFCDTDSPLRNIDIAVPCNNKNAHSIGLMWWLLAREVQRVRGTLSRDTPWDVMVDLFFYRDLAEEEKNEKVDQEAALQHPVGGGLGGAGADMNGGFGGASDWNTPGDSIVAAVPIDSVPSNVYGAIGQPVSGDTANWGNDDAEGGW